MSLKDCRVTHVWARLTSKPAAAFLFTVSSGLLGLRFDLLKMAFHFEVLPFAEPE